MTRIISVLRSIWRLLPRSGMGLNDDTSLFPNLNSSADGSVRSGVGRADLLHGQQGQMSMDSTRELRRIFPGGTPEKLFRSAFYAIPGSGRRMCTQDGEAERAVQKRAGFRRRWRYTKRTIRGMEIWNSSAQKAAPKTRASNHTARASTVRRDSSGYRAGSIAGLWGSLLISRSLGRLSGLSIVK